MKYARISLAAPLAALACGLVLGAAGTSEAAATGTTSVSHVATARVAAPVSTDLRFATFNTATPSSTADAVADIMKLAATQPDVITLQEMANPQRRAAIRTNLVSCSMCPYEEYVPDGATPGSTPILYRWDKFSIVGTGTQQVSQDTYVGPKGAGPSTLHAKYINYVELRDRATGRLVYVLNNHAVPSVQALSGGPNLQLAKRLDLYREHMAGLTSLVTQFKATGATVVVTGDFNVSYRKDRVVRSPMFPYATFNQVGLHSSYQDLGEPVLGTHVLASGSNARLIDYVGYTPQPGVQAVSQQVLTGYHSDHRPLVVTLRLSS
jgi:endonuclease/exonuclease/phosphatase (EEP) superfamily protein YafD